MELTTKSEERAQHVIGHLRAQGFERTSAVEPGPGFFSYASHNAGGAVSPGAATSSTYIVRWVAYVPFARHLEALRR